MIQKRLNKVITASCALFVVACSNTQSKVVKEEIIAPVFVSKEVAYASDNTTDVLIDAPEVNQSEIAKIVKHGDHWHVFTTDGKEIITYKDPTKAVNISDLKDTVDIVSSDTLKKNVNSSDVIRILKHGDHWHVYTAGGGEYITHSDPSGLFPGVAIGVYSGSHGDSGNKQSLDYNSKNETGERYNPGEKKLEDNTGEAVIPNIPGIIPVISLKQLAKLAIVEILQHENHWHCYTANRANEYIVNSNPKDIFPEIIIGKYEGNHGGKQIDPNSIKWPEGINKIIDHGDHWHLLIDDKEIMVVEVNPKNQYPNAEYIIESNEHGDISVSDEELFDVNSIEPKLIEDAIPYILMTDLKNMTNFGSLEDTRTPVYGSNGQKTDIFYWLHRDHYHAYSLKQIIQKVKAGAFGNNTAQEIVATVKYMMAHKGEKFEPEISDKDKKLISKYIMEYYQVDKSRLELLGTMMTVYNADLDSVSFSILFFKIENGVVTPLITLPTLKPAKNNAEISEGTVEKEVGDTDNEPKSSEGLTSSEIRSKYTRKFYMNDEQFDLALSKISGAKLIDLEFYNDGTVDYNGTTYNFIELGKGKIVEEEDYSDNTDEDSSEANYDEDESFYEYEDDYSDRDSEEDFAGEMSDDEESDSQDEDIEDLPTGDSDVEVSEEDLI